MKHVIAKIPLAFLIAFSATYAIADSPSFDFIEVGPANNYDESGFIARGNFSLDDNWFLAGSYESISFNDADFNTLVAGVGYAVNVNSSSSFYGQVSYFRIEIDSSFFDNDESGYQLGVGYRSQLTNETQLYTELNHQNVDSDSVTVLAIGLRQTLSNNLGLFAEIKRDDFGFDGYAVGINYSF